MRKISEYDIRKGDTMSSILGCIVIVAVLAACVLLAPKGTTVALACIAVAVAFSFFWYQVIPRAWNRFVDFCQRDKS